MATVPAPRTSTQKWHNIEHHSTSSFFPQIYLSGLEFLRNEKKIEKNNFKHSCSDFFWFSDFNRKKICA